MKTYTIFFLFPILLSLFPAPTPADPKLTKIIHQLFDSVKNMRSVQYKVTAVERGLNEFHTVHSEVKLQCKPRKVYLVNPAKKLEILYNSQTDADKALVKSPTLAFVSIKLDPTGNIMRKNQHYSIHELGFDFIIKALALIISKDPEGLANFTLHGKCIKNNRSCYLLEYNNNQFRYINYTVGNKETVSLIAGKLIVNEHIIRYKNNLINDFSYLKSGSILKVPNLFLKRAVVYIDEKTMLPISISIFDEKEMFETYDFTEIEVNKNFTEMDFNRKNKDYHF